MDIQHSTLVTPTENINIDSHNISERLRVHATSLKKIEPCKIVKRGEQTMQEYLKVLQNSKLWIYPYIC